MNLLTSPALTGQWATLLLLPAFLVGLIAGALLNGLHSKRRAARIADPRSRAGRLAAEAEARRESLEQLEAEIGRLDAQLAERNRLLARSREQLKEQVAEHSRLLVALDERQAAIETVRSSLRSLEQTLDARQEETDHLRGDVYKNVEELDVLEALQNEYEAKIKRLTQQVQWQDSEIRRLRQMTKLKTREIDEAAGLIERYDAELKRLHQQRQQREADLANARRELDATNTDLRRAIDRDDAGPVVIVKDQVDMEPNGLVPPRLIDVTPPIPAGPPRGLAAPAAPLTRWGDDLGIAIDDSRKDDLTQIPGLGDYFARQLEAGGILNFWQLARLTPPELDRLLEIPGHYSPDLVGWIESARKLVLEQHYGPDRKA